MDSIATCNQLCMRVIIEDPIDFRLPRLPRDHGCTCGSIHTLPHLGSTPYPHLLPTQSPHRLGYHPPVLTFSPIPLAELSHWHWQALLGVWHTQARLTYSSSYSLLAHFSLGLLVRMRNERDISYIFSPAPSHSYTSVPDSLLLIL